MADFIVIWDINMKIKLNPEKVSSFTESDDFTPGAEYTVITEEGYDSYRLLPDLEGPCLYPKDLFIVTDPTRPPEWEDGYGPVELLKPGFFEDYFDDKPYAIEIFNAYIQALGLPLERWITPEGKVKRRNHPHPPPVH